MGKAKSKKPIGLGDRVKDPVSGFQGIVTCVSSYLNGCIRVGVAPEKLKDDGQTQDDHYFDVAQMKLLKAAVHIPVSVKTEPPGGPAREGKGFRR